MIAVLAFTLISCTAAKAAKNDSGFREYVKLPTDKILVTGSGERLANTTSTFSTQSYITKIVSMTYTLQRSYYQSGVQNEFQYGDYWYRLNISQVTDQELLGTQTIKTDTSYEYLIYTENEALSIKKTTVTSTSFDYEGGWIEREYIKNVELNGYFLNQAELFDAIPQFKAMIGTKNTQKYYIDVTVPVTTNVTYNNVNDFYYFE